MKKHFVMGLTFLCATALLSGCGFQFCASTPHANHTNTLTTKNVVHPSMHTSRPTNPFPVLIQHAMEEVSSKINMALYAPTVFPGSVHTPLPVSVLTETSLFAPAPHYRVLFMSGNIYLGAYQVSKWPSNQIAAQHLILSQSDKPPLPKDPTAGTTISLGLGITAHMRIYGTHSGQQVIAWQEGRWDMGVTFTLHNRARALAVAKRVVAFAHSNFLPPPAVRGLAMVNLIGSTASSVLAWQQKSVGFKTQTIGSWNSNLSSGYLYAFSMAITMQSYPKKLLAAQAMPQSFTTQQLFFNLRNTLLREMSNPAQGDDCLNASCRLTATQFSGPSVTNQKQTLRMATAQFGQWYLLVSPMKSDPLSVLQGVIQHPPHFPFASGVAVIQGSHMNEYWIRDGKKYASGQSLP